MCNLYIYAMKINEICFNDSSSEVDFYSVGRREQRACPRFQLFSMLAHDRLILLRMIVPKTIKFAGWDV